MSHVKDWSTDPDNNNASPPAGAPENATLISDLNDIDRNVMSGVREAMEDIGWFNFGHTVTRTGDTTFTIAADDVTAIYTAERSIRVQGATTTTHVVQSSVFGGGNTTVTVDGTLPASMDGQTVSVAAKNEAGRNDVYDKTEVDNKIANAQILVPTAVEDNLATFDDAGQVKDSGSTIADLLSVVELAEKALPASNGSANIVSIAHGQTGTPAVLSVVLRCKTAELGYAIGEEVPVPTEITSSGGNLSGSYWSVDGTNINYLPGASYNQLWSKAHANFARTNITLNNWRIVARILV